MLIKVCLIFVSILCSQRLYSQTEERGITEEQRSFLEDESDKETTEPANSPNMNALLLKTILLLGGLCGAVVVSAYLVRRMSGGRFNSFSTEGTIRLIERKYLSPKTSLWLVEVHNQSFLVLDSQQHTSMQQVTSVASKEESST